MRAMKKTFKELRDRLIQQQEEAQALQKQQLEQQQQQAQAALEQAALLEQQKMENENYQSELDRINKKEIAIIQATGFGQVESEDVNNNNIPDVLEVSKFAAEEANATRTHITKMAEINSKAKMDREKLNVEKEKLKNERLNMANDLQIAKTNAKNRSTKKK